MRKKNKFVSDLAKKLEFDKKRGKSAKRVIFETGVPQCLWIDKGKPYGSIPVCDDMTENDVLESYRKHKKERITYLRNSGIRTRKHITKNALRDHEWHSMRKRYSGTPDYKKMAKKWASKNRKETTLMLLKYLWKHKNECMSTKLKNIINTASSTGQTFDTFSKQCCPSILKSDLNQYIDFYLPRIIRSAINRYKQLK